MSDHPHGGTETWGFGNVAAALLIARTAWPFEADDARQSWSKRLADPADRALLDQEYRRARDRLDSAYALLAAAPAPTRETCEAEECNKPRTSGSLLCGWHDVNGEPCTACGDVPGYCPECGGGQAPGAIPPAAPAPTEAGACRICHLHDEERPT